MKIIDPVPFLGIDSGLRTMVVTKAEAAVLLRAVAIIERGHDLLTDYDPDHQDQDGITGLCLAPDTLRRLATEGLEL